MKKQLMICGAMWLLALGLGLNAWRMRPPATAQFYTTPDGQRAMVVRVKGTHRLAPGKRTEGQCPPNCVASVIPTSRTE